MHYHKTLVSNNPLDSIAAAIQELPNRNVHFLFPCYAATPYMTATDIVKQSALITTDGKEYGTNSK